MFALNNFVQHARLNQGKIMTKIVAIVGSVIGLTLLSGCGEQLASEAQKAADQITVEATKIATKQIDAFKNDTLEQLKKMRGEGNNGTADAKTEPQSR